MTNPISIFIPRVAQGFYGFAESIRRTASEDDLRTPSVWNVWVKGLGGELAKEAIERRVSLGRAILERGLQVDFAKGILIVRFFWDKDSR